MIESIERSKASKHRKDRKTRTHGSKGSKDRKLPRYSRSAQGQGHRSDFRIDFGRRLSTSSGPRSLGPRILGFCYPLGPGYIDRLRSRPAEFFEGIWFQTPPLNLTQNLIAYQFWGP